MTYIAKPKLAHPAIARNELGYTRRYYEGAVSTLCAGCKSEVLTLGASDDQGRVVLLSPDRPVSNGARMH
jgi:hypothetical protein